MGRKSAKHRKLKITDKWMNYCIEFTVGSQLTHIRILDAEFVEQTIDVIKKVIKLLEKKEDWTDRREEFVKNCQHLVLNVFNDRLSTYLLIASNKGFDKDVSKIIQNSTGASHSE